MSDNTELLPCPFCGGKAHWPEPEVNIHYVGCMSCAACATGVEHWNHRTAPPAAKQPDTVKVRRELLERAMYAKDGRELVEANRELRALLAGGEA